MSLKRDKYKIQWWPKEDQRCKKYDLEKHTNGNTFQKKHQNEAMGQSGRKTNGKE